VFFGFSQPCPLKIAQPKIPSTGGNKDEMAEANERAALMMGAFESDPEREAPFLWNPCSERRARGPGSDGFFAFAFLIAWGIILEKALLMRLFRNQEKLFKKAAGEKRLSESDLKKLSRPVMNILKAGLAEGLESIGPESGNEFHRRLEGTMRLALLAEKLETLGRRSLALVSAGSTSPLADYSGQSGALCTVLSALPLQGKLLWPWRPWA
jgi:hypothetical protein